MRGRYRTQKQGLSEAQLEQELLYRATLLRWRAHHVRDSRTVLMGDAGAPDWWLARDGKLVVVELKAEDGKLSPEQAAWMAALGWRDEQSQWAVERSATRLEVYVIRPSSAARFWEVLE